jgi:hypothetical protein
VTANITLPDNFNGFANSSGDATLSGSFEITGVTGPVNITLSTALAITQSLQTSGSGVSASSEAIFTLLLPDVDPVNPQLVYDNLLTIGPAQTLISPASPTLTTSLSLQGDTPYSFVASLDAESSGISVPEPSSLCLALSVLGLAALLSRGLTKKPRPDDRG